MARSFNKLYTKNLSVGIANTKTVNSVALPCQAAAMSLAAPALNAFAGTLGSTKSELNILDGVTATTSELNILDGVTASTSELNLINGCTNTTAELNLAAGLTANKSELNLTASLAATKSEINNACDNSARRQELTATGAVTAGKQEVELNHASTIIAATIANSNAHQGIFIVRNTSASGTTAHTLTLSAGSFDGTNTVATLNAPKEALIVYFDSAGDGTIIENVGSVGLA